MLPPMRIALLALCGCLLGCETAPRAAQQLGVDARTFPEMTDLRSGEVITWAYLLKEVEAVDVILVGEFHDHDLGHAIELALVEDMVDRWPASSVAMEMLERDEQGIVDDYKDGIIDAERFQVLAEAKSWYGLDGWNAWYQPIIDAAPHVVAANSPRQYVSLARRDGYDALDALPPARRRLAVHPETLDDGPYWERFLSLVPEGHYSDDDIRAFFLAQQVWDATMAASVDEAAPSRDAKVLLIVGAMHVEYRGGVVEMLHRRRPDLRVLTIAIHRAWPTDDLIDDPPRADIVIVGEAPR